jgi:acetyl-CoA C-acetyltransferase
MHITRAYLVDGVRTPIGRYAGALASVRPDDLAAHVIEQLLARHASVAPDMVDEVLLGCANQAGEDNRNIARMATLLAGLPVSVPGTTVNRLCGSGLDAVAMGVRQIAVGEADLVIAGGVESMSRAPFVIPKAPSAFARSNELHDTTIGWRFINQRLAAEYGTEGMPETAENVAALDRVSREDQDAFAMRSQNRAAAAVKRGRLGREIVPVPVATGKHTVTVEHDEHPRPTTLEKLSSLRAPFRKGGTVTAGNASGVNDGAAALLLASESAVERLGLEPLACVVATATAGVEPGLMGLGPVPATEQLLGRRRLTMADVDLLELNEAFAAQALACVRRLGLPDDADHVNPNGGAIALGHPLGMSGARLVLTAGIELCDLKARRALVTMCVGVGQGIAMLLERP